MESYRTELVEFKYAWTDDGVLSVMTTGMTLMPLSSAGSWDTLVKGTDS